MAKLLSKGIQLFACEDPSAATPLWQQLKFLKSTPDIGGEAEKVDTTDLESENKESIAGIGDFGDLEFGFFLNAEDARDQANAAEIKEGYTYLRKYEKDKKSLHFKLMYPHGMGFQWKGSVGTVLLGAEVNSALEYKLKTALEGAMEDVTS